MKNFFKLAAATSLLALSATGAQAANIIYAANFQVGATGNVTGSFTTDGTIGALTGANFVAWNFVISGKDGHGHLISETLTNGNSSVFSGSMYNNGIVGAVTGLAATATALTFNFSNPSPSFLLFQKQFGSGTSFLCAATAGTNLCDSGFGLVPFNPEGGPGSFAGQGASTEGGPVQTGITLIGTTVPEPSTWMTMFAGLGLIGFAMRRKPTVSTRASIAFAS